jgi:DNA-binding protein HU-beta
MALNKSEVVAAIASKTDLSQAKVGSVIDELFAVIAQEVGKDGGKVTLPGFLSVERTKRAARTGRNPQTGATIQIAASNGVKISAGSKLKAAAK